VDVGERPQPADTARGASLRTDARDSASGGLNGCCDKTTARVPDTDVSRRSLIKGAALLASAIPAARSAQGQGKQIKLAY
jgi:hypothetical protein